MAQLTAGFVESFQLYSGIESQVIETSEASATALDWYKGDLVKWNGSGQVATIASAGAIAGIAQASCTGVTDTKFDIHLIDPVAIYVCRVEYGKYSALAYVGNNYSLNWTAGTQRIDIDVTTAEVYIVGIHPSDTHVDGSTGLDEGRVLVRFNYDIFTGV